MPAGSLHCRSGVGLGEAACIIDRVLRCRPGVGLGEAAARSIALQHALPRCFVLTLKNSLSQRWSVALGRDGGVGQVVTAAPLPARCVPPVCAALPPTPATLHLQLPPRHMVTLHERAAPHLLGGTVRVVAAAHHQQAAAASALPVHCTAHTCTEPRTAGVP